MLKKTYKNCSEQNDEYSAMNPGLQNLAPEPKFVVMMTLSWPLTFFGKVKFALEGIYIRKKSLDIDFSETIEA